MCQQKIIFVLELEQRKTQERIFGSLPTLGFHALERVLGGLVIFGHAERGAILRGSALFVALLCQNLAEQVRRLEGGRLFVEVAGGEIPPQQLRRVWDVASRSEHQPG